MEPLFRASSESERMEMARAIAKGKLRKRGNALTPDAIEREAQEAAKMICVMDVVDPETKRIGS